MYNSRTVGFGLVTYNGGHNLEKLLSKIEKTIIFDKVICIDSESTDTTKELLMRYQIEYESIKQKDFNHGATREKLRKLLNTDIVVFITQDVWFEDAQVILKLIEPILEGKCQISYARQLPRKSATIIEQLECEFFYPESSELRVHGQLTSFGAPSFFSSNSCCAYDNSVLSAIGGFPETDFMEDWIVASRVLKSGGRILYNSEARVFHSHKPSIYDSFNRSYLMALTREKFEGDLKEGNKAKMSFKSYALKQLLLKKDFSIFFFILIQASKLLGRIKAKLTYAAR